ncbi:MAG TPA: N-acetylmuramoyl-L-alanine amidase, partial [Longimicrobium sp.]|nr:N-acetylmuramoyl-L-alanine amidase [Longimicrobium sp.]
AIQQLNITVDLIPQGSSNRPGIKISPTHITIHNTSNDAKGADAAMHARYVKGADARARQVSWHFTVDDKRTFKHLPTNEKGWHAGKGNGVSIGIEVCENKGINKAAVIDRAALLTALMMLAYRIPRDNVVPHKFWTGKDCPRVLLREAGGFDSFRDRAAGFLAQLQGGPAGGVAPEGMDVSAFPSFEDTAVSPELAAFVDEAEAPAMAFGPAGYEDPIAQMERMIGRLALENYQLKQALEQAQGAGPGMGVEPETD